MRKSNQQSIGQALETFMKEYKLGKQLKRSEIIANWESLVGKMVANHTKNIFFSEDNTLFVELDSPSLRHELTLSKNEIIQRLNEAAGSNFVRNIVIK